MFDTKVAILVLDDLATWQKLNVAAFLATGIAAAAPDAMGEPYEDAAGREFARLLGQPMLIFAAGESELKRAHRISGEKGLVTRAEEGCRQGDQGSEAAFVSAHAAITIRLQHTGQARRASRSERHLVDGRGRRRPER